MLFDLQSGRRRVVVRVVYTMLAVSFLIGFVIFGVGSSGVGGIGDLLGGGSSGDNAAESAQQASIDSAEKQLKKDPKDPEALVSLTRAYYLAGAGAADLDENGQPVPSDETLSEWNKALDAWERYLKTDPKEPDAQLAPQMANAYQAVGDFSGAAATQQLVVDAQPNSFNYGRLAFFFYADGKLDEGKAAGDQAIAKAKGAQKKQLQKALDSLAKQAESIQKATKKQSEAGGNQLQDPFGSLGGGGGAPVIPGG
jgi:tetratricopeptide (TPR) repeat protein